MTKEEKIKIKKDHITKTLADLLSKRVYSQISIEDVAEAAGLSKGGLRHYFATKEELYTELIENFFGKIQMGTDGVLNDLNFDIEDKAFMSTLFGIEQFLIDKKNIRVFINIILYGFEDEKIMNIIRRFIRNHLEEYDSMIVELGEKSQGGAASDAQFKARITQIILLFAGLFEYIDPIEMETPKLVEYILKMIRK